MKNNYKDYDTLTLYVKKNKLAEIIEYYQIFGWQLVKESENKRYEDIVDLTFTRPHKINNKDELQLQQVYMEEKLNSLGKIERNKHSKTTSFGLCFGVITLAIIVLAILVLIKANSVYGIISGSVIALMGLVLILFEVKLIHNIYNHEILIFNQVSNELKIQISMITKRVKELTGGEYGQD